MRRIILSKQKKEGDKNIIEDVFKLIQPRLFYKDLKKYLLNLSEYNFGINNIFLNNKIHLLNNILFSLLKKNFNFIIYLKNVNF